MSAELAAYALRLSPTQRRALIQISSHGALRQFPRGYGRRHDAAANFIRLTTARALHAVELVSISTSYIALTPRGRRYAAALAAMPDAIEVIEARANDRHHQQSVADLQRFGAVDRILASDWAGIAADEHPVPELRGSRLAVVLSER